MSLYRPEDVLRISEAEAPRFLDSRYMKVATFSAIRTGRLYPSEDIPGNHLC